MDNEQLSNTHFAQPKDLIGWGQYNCNHCNTYNNKRLDGTS